ncbi:hypothetical protein [Hungatella hathewayi]|uniref:Uncharacterized protein n=1 Tax=Hungatella hathewayi WAL-18680 TaxID=742737 RepID=G5II12_9FIRM|nr:hypothetical protein [Hungatella hathewayi]EHI58918.1 hypothetical protein HMPREF9473_03140 [ [Hungatella hathewayi WAL-18680]
MKEQKRNQESQRENLQEGRQADWKERQKGKRQESRREKQPENGQIGVGQISGPAGAKTSRSKHRHRRNRWISMTAVLLFLAVGSAAVVSCYGFPTLIQAQLDIRPEKHAKKGTLASGEPGEVKPVEAGSFRVMLNQLPTIETGSRDCNIEYENPEENHYSSRISLYLKETGRLIGGTTRVDPGYYVESIRLKKSLPAGEYPVTVRIELFEEKIPAGEMSIDITLRIIEKQEGETG